MKKVIFGFFIFLILIYGCAQEVMQEEPDKMMEDTGMEEKEMESKAMESMEKVEEEAEEREMHIDWKSAELTDVLTGENFKISDFKGKPILLESFAVWCPICKRQQDRIKELHKEVGDSVVSISLDTDPNEDKDQVIGHVNRYGYNWRFAVSPVDVTKALIDEFSVSVVNAPRAPVVLICEDQTARMLGRGVKSANTLKSEIEKGC